MFSAQPNTTQKNFNLRRIQKVTKSSKKGASFTSTMRIFNCSQTRGYNYWRLSGITKTLGSQEKLMFVNYEEFYF